MANFLDSFIFISSLLLNFLTIVALDIETTYNDGNLCTTKLEKCSLNTESESLMLASTKKGEKGEKGDQGYNGTLCEQGEKGEIGRQGIAGAPGLKGDLGGPGLNGEKGDKGIKGDVGAKGVQGPPGLTGTCECLQPKEFSTEDAYGGEIGEFDTPATGVCKRLPVDEGSIYTYFSGSQKTKVDCLRIDAVNLWTCIPANNTKLKLSPATEDIPSAPYWLSSKGFRIEDLYGLDSIQLAGIQIMSTKVIQKIKYHCKKSTPFNPEDEDKSLLLLSWNDIVFGPKQNENTPFTYRVPSDTDFCLNSSGEENSTVIEIETDLAQRLPVVDFLIRDHRDSLTDIQLEHMQLCFL